MREDDGSSHMTCEMRASVRQRQQHSCVCNAQRRGARASSSARTARAATSTRWWCRHSAHAAQPPHSAVRRRTEGAAVLPSASCPGGGANDVAKAGRPEVDARWASMSSAARGSGGASALTWRCGAAASSRLSAPRGRSSAPRAAVTQRSRDPAGSAACASARLTQSPLTRQRTRVSHAAAAARGNHTAAASQQASVT